MTQFFIHNHEDCVKIYVFMVFPLFFGSFSLYSNVVTLLDCMMCHVVVYEITSLEMWAFWFGSGCVRVGGDNLALCSL